MDNSKYGKYKTAFLAAGALIVLLEIPGAIGVLTQPYDGFWIEPGYAIIRVVPDSPAQRAGLMVGDILKSIDGIEVKDSKALARHPNPKVGETRAYVVERNGKAVSLDLKFSGLPAREIVLGFAYAAIGFCILICGLWVYLKVQTGSTTLLAMASLCFGFGLMNAPNLDSYALRLIYWSVRNVVELAGLATMLHFLMAFPKPKAWLERNHTLFVLYGPASLAALFVLFLILLQPEGTSALNNVTNILLGVLWVAYVAAAVIALAHSYVKANREERTAYGLHVLLLGTVIGLLPVLITVSVSVVAPKVVLPGAEFYELTTVLVPFSVAQAVMRKERIIGSPVVSWATATGS